MIFAVDVNQKTVKQSGHSMSHEALIVPWQAAVARRVSGFVAKCFLCARQRLFIVDRFEHRPTLKARRGIIEKPTYLIEKKNCRMNFSLIRTDSTNLISRNLSSNLKYRKIKKWNFVFHFMWYFFSWYIYRVYCKKYSHIFINSFRLEAYVIA